MTTDLRTTARTYYADKLAAEVERLTREREANRIADLNAVRQQVTRILCLPAEVAATVIPDSYDGGYIDVDGLCFLYRGGSARTFSVFGRMTAAAQPTWETVTGLYGLGALLEGGFEPEDRRAWALITDEEGDRAFYVRTGEVDAALASAGKEFSVATDTLW